MENSRSMVGAYLHAARIAHAARLVGVENASGSLKTVKLPVTTYSQEADADLAAAVQSDDTRLLGISSDVALYELARRGKEPYSVLDFWYATVCLGGVFASKISLIGQVVATLSGAKSPTEAALESSPHASAIRLTRAADFLTKRKRSTSTLGGTAKQIRDAFSECPYTDEEVIKLAAQILGADTAEAERDARSSVFGIAAVASEVSLAKPKREIALGLTVCLLPGREYLVPPKARAGRDMVLLSRFRLLSERLGEQNEKDAYQYLGLNENAFSSFLGTFFPKVRSGGLGEIADAMIALCPAWEQRSDELFSRLEHLREQARRLPEAPNCAAGWNDYRSRLAGRLVSWFSGYLGKLAIAVSQLDGARRDVAFMDELLDEHSDPASNGDIELAESVSFLGACLERAAGTEEERVQAMRAVRIVLPGVAYELNQFLKRPAVQEQLAAHPPTPSAKAKVKDNKPVEFPDAFPHIVRLQAVPPFFGDESRRRFHEFMNAARYLDQFLSNLQAIWNDLLQSPRVSPPHLEQYFLRHVARVFGVYKKLNTTKFRERVREALLPVLLVDFVQLPERAYFCTSAPAAGERSKRIPVVVPFSEEQALGHCLDVCAALSTAAGFDWKLTPEERIDVIELQRTAFAFLAGISDCAIDIGQYDWCACDTVADFLSVCGSTRLEGRLLNQFLQQAVFSKLRGASTLLSKDKLRARFEIQSPHSLEMMYYALGCTRRVGKESKFSVKPSSKNPGMLDCRIAYPVVVGREERVYVRTFTATRAEESGEPIRWVYTPFSEGSETIRVIITSLGEAGYEVVHMFRDSVKRHGTHQFRAELVRDVKRPDGGVDLLYGKRPVSPGFPGVPRELKSDFLKLPPAEFIASLGDVSAIEREKRLQLRTYPHQLGYRLWCEQARPGARQPKPGELLLVEKPVGDARFGAARPVKADSSGSLLWVQGKPHQRQYLEWFLARFYGRKADVVLKAPSLIAEWECAVSWDLEKLTPILKEEGGRRLFVAQPFAMLPLLDRPMRPKIVDEAPRFLGIDAGERGVGYTMAACSGGEYEVLAQGFAPVPELASLLSGGAQYKRAQNRGTHDFRSRRGALRDVASRVLRNTIHNLRLRHNDIPVFEWMPKARGADSLEGIYTAAKRSDLPQNEADYTVRRTVWGISANPAEPFALELFVRGTSQFCSACRRWYQLSFQNGHTFSGNEPKEDGIRVVAYDEGVVTFALPGNTAQVYGYNPALKVGDRVAADLAARSVHAFMRPPLSNRFGEVTKTYTRFLRGKSWRGYTFDQEFVEKFGGRAMYVCPFTDCTAVAHADVQAAETLALLGHVFRNWGLKKEEWRDPAVVWDVLSKMKRKEG